MPADTEIFLIELKPGRDPLERRQGITREPIYRLKRLLKFAARDCGFRIRWGQSSPPVELSERDDDESGGPMVRFLGGVADGVRLTLRRAPLFLRVVFDAVKQKWDALDQLSDTPSAGEVIYVYVRIGEPTAAMLDWTEGGRRRGSRIAMAMYKPAAEQPDDATVRDTERWRAWCWAAAKQLPK